MKTRPLDIRDLRTQLTDFETRHRGLSADEVFTAWFFRAYITADEEEAVKAVAGGSGDKGIDGVLIENRARRIFIVQAKNRKHLGQHSEKRADLLQLSDLARVLSDDDGKFREFLNDLEPRTAELLRDARRRIKHDDFTVILYFVTLGKAGPAAIRDAVSTARKYEAVFELHDGRRLMTLLRDYLDGAAPPIPTLDLPMETAPGIRVNGILQRYDSANRLESWAFSVRGDSVAEIFDANGVRLFARNVRGFLGAKAEVNSAIGDTLRREPGHFFYYNNGITIVCDRAERISHRGHDVLRISNPQVINGQQTVRMLHEYATDSARASVLVKVIQVPRGQDGGEDAFVNLVSRIVQATNWQSAIRASDLMANDRLQIDLERELRKVDYLYARKRQAKGEIRRQMVGRRLRVISKEDLAQAVAGCELDPVVARSGKDNLFTEEHYSDVFPTSDPDYFLNRYWLMKIVTHGARGFPQRGYTKWLVLGAAWRRFGPAVKGSRNARAFRELAERDDVALWRPLGLAVDLLFSAALRYYRANRGTGARELDVSLFFRSKRGRQHEFESWLLGRERVAGRKLAQMFGRAAASVAAEAS